MKGRGIEIAAFVQREKGRHFVGAEAWYHIANRVVGEDGRGIDAGALAGRTGTVLQMKAVTERLRNRLGGVRIVGMNLAPVGQSDFYRRETSAIRGAFVPRMELQQTDEFLGGCNAPVLEVTQRPCAIADRAPRRDVQVLELLPLHRFHREAP